MISELQMCRFLSFNENKLVFKNWVPVIGMTFLFMGRGG